MKTLLIVEDNVDLQEIFQRAFEQYAYTIHVVADGAQALAFLAHALPDVMVLDINMPKVSGLDVLTQARNIQGDHHIHIIVVTGNYLAEHSPASKLADLFLVKPVSVRELVKLAERLTQS